MLVMYTMFFNAGFYLCSEFNTNINAQMCIHMCCVCALFSIYVKRCVLENIEFVFLFISAYQQEIFFVYMQTFRQIMERISLRIT
jgi:hypothetical protein